MFYDRRGEEITAREWNDLRKESVIASTKLGSDTQVQTLWLGIDFGKGPTGRPLIFETMIFSQSCPTIDTLSRRYETEEQALFGHERMVADAKQALEGLAEVDPTEAVQEIIDALRGVYGAVPESVLRKTAGTAVRAIQRWQIERRRELDR